MGRLFGTDGARGVANTELTCELSMQIGRAAAVVLTKNLNGKKPKVLIGLDTRASSQMLENAITAGLCSVGADVLKLGVVPTPAVAYLVKEYGYDAGIMISASHNPCEYNGIKIFQSNGYKLPDALENEIEAIILDNAIEIPTPIGGGVGKAKRKADAINDYIEHLLSATNMSFKGYKIALDCANGSSSVSAEEVFTRLGAEVVVISDKPDGVNINKDCGSTHLENLQRVVVENGCDLGFAFDGDADRMLAVDEQGNIIDGDQIMAIIGNHMKSQGKLKHDTIVATVMSNLGFYIMARERGLNIEQTKVGDRYVLERMREIDASLGGEQSGHVIFLEENTTGDGLLSALHLLQVMVETGKSLSELASIMSVMPQALVNAKVPTHKKDKYMEYPEIAKAIEELEAKFAGEGRVLIRPSGTEPKVRVMIEGKEQKVIEQEARKLADLIQNTML
mgnify:CR=1 FL=1